jgi:predicted alpha/beta hydrolase
MYTLDQNHFGEWYVVPLIRMREWRKWCDDAYEYQEKPDDFVREPEIPEGVQKVTSPSDVVFPDYEIHLF